MNTKCFKFFNYRTEKILIRLEPWAELYEVLLGERIDIISFSDEEPPSLEMVLEKDDTITFWPTTQGILRVYKDGVELEPSFEQ